MPSSPSADSSNASAVRDRRRQRRRPGSTRARLTRLLRWLWRSALEEEAIWRLLIGESLRGEPGAREMSSALVAGLDAALPSWIADVVPELGDRAGSAARLARALVFSLMVEHLALGPDDARGDARIADLVDVLTAQEAGSA